MRVFWSLTAANRSIIIEALVLPICITLAFRWFGVPRTQAMLRGWARAAKTGKTPEYDLGIRYARRAQRIVKRNTGIAGNCLVRSLTLWAILLRRGLPTDLRVGFRKRDGQIEGHAWVEHNNVPVNESIVEARTFVPYEQPVSFDLLRRMERSEPVA
jgi:hypothetical protein